INTYGGKATALTGENEGLLSVEPKDERLGFVGEVTGVDPEIITRLHTKGEIPVISTIGQNSEGQAFNINADTAAGALAGALRAEKAMYLSDVPGVLVDKNDPSSIISAVKFKDLFEMIENEVISDGMVPKVRSCIHALERGAKAAHLLDGRVPHVLLLELFTDSGVGTMVLKGEEYV
ncbi:MAG: acetylglutamate kinase, partial [Actinomycetota bacterium]|nr:acetylglutamate kinase [Actinomycetota bacterium]